MRTTNAITHNPSLHARARQVILDAYLTAQSIIEKIDAESIRIDEDDLLSIQDLCGASWGSLTCNLDDRSDHAERALRLALKRVQEHASEGPLEGLIDRQGISHVAAELREMDALSTNYLKANVAGREVLSRKFLAGANTFDVTVSVIEEPALGTLLRTKVRAANVRGSAEASAAAWAHHSPAFAPEVSSVTGGVGDGESLIASSHAAEICASLLDSMRRSRSIADLATHGLPVALDSVVARINSRATPGRLLNYFAQADNEILTVDIDLTGGAVVDDEEEASQEELRPRARA